MSLLILCCCKYIMFIKARLEFIVFLSEREGDDFFWSFQLLDFCGKVEILMNVEKE